MSPLPLGVEPAVVLSLLEFALLLHQGQVLHPQALVLQLPLPQLLPQERLQLLQLPDPGLVHRNLRLLRDHLGAVILNLDCIIRSGLDLNSLLSLVQLLAGY